MESGDIDANAFQHLPYLQNQIKTRGYHIVSVGWTTVSPIGIYSHKIHAIDQIAEKARIGIPNDPSNGGRGLLLLQAQKVIKLRDEVGLLPTPLDIVENPKKIAIVELDAGIIARSVDDLTAAVVNTDWAVRAGLDLSRDLVAREAVADNPYRNIIAVKEGHQNDPRIKTFVAAYQTDRLRAFLDKQYHGTTIAAW